MSTQAKITVTAEDRASRVLGQVRDQLQSTHESALTLARSAGLLGPALAFTGAASLVAMVKGALDARDALNDVADATGASIEGLSGLERVAKLNGGTLEQVSGILVKFNQALNQAADGDGKAAQVFQALGLSVKELQGLDPSEALRRAAVALAGFADDGNKARAVQELFGKSIREAAPFLKDLAEAGKLHATVTTEQAAQAERLNRQLYALRVAAEDAGRALTQKLGGIMVELVERFKAANTAFGGLLGALQAGVSQKLNFSDAAEGLRVYNQRLAELDANILKAQQAYSDRPGLLTIRLKALQSERAELAKVADYYRTILNASSAASTRGVDDQQSRPSLKLPAKVTLPAKIEIDDASRALAQYVEQLQRQIDKTKDLNEVQKAQDVLRSLGVKGEVPQVRALVLGLAQEVDQRERGVALAKLMTAELERQNKEQADLDETLARFSGRLDDARKQALTARLEQRLAAGDIFSPEELERIVKGIGGIKDEADKTFDAAAKSAERFAQNVQDALGDTIERTLKGDFDSIGELWGNLLIKMAAQALAADLGNLLFGDILGKTGSGNLGLFGSLVNSVFGVGLGRAYGGTVQPWSAQRINERGGFETLSMGGQDWLLTGPRGGYVTPSQGGGSVTVSVVQNISGPAAASTRTELTQWKALVRREAYAAVSDAVGRGAAMRGVTA